MVEQKQKQHAAPKADKGGEKGQLPHILRLLNGGDQQAPDGRCHHQMDTTLFAYLRENPPQGHSLEYADCRLSLLSAQKGKCSVSGELFLNPDNIVCHMKVPKEQGGHERYSNLVLLHRRYLPLLTDQDTAALKSMCKQLTVTKKQLTKINSLRTAAKLVAI